MMINIIPIKTLCYLIDNKSELNNHDYIIYYIINEINHFQFPLIFRFHYHKPDDYDVWLNDIGYNIISNNTWLIKNLYSALHNAYYRFIHDGITELTIDKIYITKKYIELLVSRR